MKERPILFSTEMVKAILANRKKQTRRILKNIPRMSDNIDSTAKILNEYENFKHRYSPFGKPGDLIWVKETYSLNDKRLIYRANVCSEHDLPDGFKWKSSMFMPKKLARMWLKITDIKVERLEDISCEDAKNEGIDFAMSPIGFCGKDYFTNSYNLMTTPVLSYLSLWRVIHKMDKYAKTGNPWVWVIKFELISTTGAPVKN